MSADNGETYGVLNRFIDDFFPVQWVTREEHNILDKDGEPMFEARPINTKVLVEFRSYGQVVALLGLYLLGSYIFTCFLVLFSQG